MTPAYAEEIAAYIVRAGDSLEAARHLAATGYHDFAASRAYYAAFYAATAALLAEGFETSKHSGVIAAILQRFVRTARLGVDQGKALNWLFELRDVGDYGVMAHISQQEAEQAIAVAESFVAAIKKLIGNGP